MNEPILGMLDFPELRQTYNFDCGVTCLQEIMCYYGIEERESFILDDLKALDPKLLKNGVKLTTVKKYAEKNGLKAEIKEGLNPKDLIALIDKKIPVIVLLQAWRDEKSPDNWIHDFIDGHYVVAIGYTKNKIIFEDPSSFTRTYLSFRELSERWHDCADDDEKKHIYGVGVIIKGKPKFRSNEINHMG
jgi:uncharacterized protein